MTRQVPDITQPASDQTKQTPDMTQPASDQTRQTPDMPDMPDKTRPQSAASKSKVTSMFDRIAHRYDLLNRLLSFGQDQRWRARVASHLPDKKGLSILDIATGTGDQILALCKQADIASALGIDLSENMLEIGRAKIKRRNLDKAIRLQTGDAEAIPAEDAGFDALTISFGIRNVSDVARALLEMRRVLKKGGRAIILEFSLPGNRLMRALYLFYFRRVLPRIGGAISGDSDAYRYLNRTVESFPHGEAFCDLMRAAGFKDVAARPLTFGIATIYQGDNPAPRETA